MLKHVTFVCEDGHVRTFSVDEQNIQELLGECDGSLFVRSIDKFAVFSSPVCQISHGYNHSGIVTAQGQVFMFCWQHEKVESVAESHNILQASYGTLTSISCSFFHGESIFMLACRGNTTAAVSAKGKLFTWGENRGGLLGLDNHVSFQVDPVHVTAGAIGGQFIVMAGIGAEHMIALSTDGLVFSWGSNSAGQLDRREGDFKTPGVCFQNYRAKFIAAESNYNLVITREGHLYGWGESFGSLQQIEACKKEKFCMVACGIIHSLALTDDGSVWEKTNKFEADDLSSSFEISRFSKIDHAVFQGMKVEMVACQRLSCAAVTREGCLWIWGFYEQYSQPDELLLTEASNVTILNSIEGPTPCNVNCFVGGQVQKELEKIIAFCMGTNVRLNQNSRMKIMQHNLDVVEMICELAFPWRFSNANKHDLHRGRKLSSGL